MRQSTRALTILIVALPLAVGCSRASHTSSTAPRTYSAVSAAPEPPPTPIPGHPPVTETGVVATFDPATRFLAFQDGRAVKLTWQSQVLQPKVMQPVDPAAIRPGDRVVVQNALPIGVRTGSSAGKRQHMGTVASVNQQKQTVQLTDGGVIRVTPSTSMHTGMEGTVLALTDLRPGDEVVVLMPTTGTPTTRYATTGSQPSAAPQAVITGSPSEPSDANEMMVFREMEEP